MSKVLVTPRSVTRGGHASLDALREVGHEVIFCKPGVQPTEEELMSLLPGCVGYVAGVEKVGAGVLEAAVDLRVISRNGTGVDGIDLEAARRRGILICRAQGANARGVAELTLGLILSLARSIPYSDKGLKVGGWERRKGLELEGKILGVIGCGKVGQIVSRLALGFDMKVLAYDVFQAPGFRPGESFKFTSFDEIISRADFLSLHCPPTGDGRPLLDAALLKRAKKGVYIVNTARPGLIERQALTEALESGQVAGAAFDVHDHEPPGDDPLVGHERVVATPHIGGFTDESVERAMCVAVENLLEALKTVESGA